MRVEGWESSEALRAEESAYRAEEVEREVSNDAL
jgi:hypothetical protein